LLVDAEQVIEADVFAQRYRQDVRFALVGHADEGIARA